MDLFGYIVEETIMVGYQGVTHLNKYKNIMQFIWGTNMVCRSCAVILAWIKVVGHAIKVIKM